MYFSKMPKKGDEIPSLYNSLEKTTPVVIEVTPYTGAYPQYFTHVMRYTAPHLRRGWIETVIDVASHRKK